MGVKVNRKFLWLAIVPMLTTNILATTQVKMIIGGNEIVYEKESEVDCTGFFLGDNMKHYSQWDTGEYANINCGPTSVKMLGSYFEKDLSVESMNSYINPYEYGYYVSNIESMLEKYGVEYSRGYFVQTSDGTIKVSNLVDYIDKKHIMLLAINTSSISTRNTYETDNFKSTVGRTYTGDFNHFVICTGYIIVNEVTYFQILDPLETGYTYIDANELVKGIASNWKGCLVFNK